MYLKFLWIYLPLHKLLTLEITNINADEQSDVQSQLCFENKSQPETL